MELHVNFHHLYVQCFNDPLIYAIETTSAIVVQTIKTTSEEIISLENQNTFTVSPCGSFIFSKCPNDDQVKCIRTSNEEQIGQFRIPISLTTRKYTVTSLNFHPTQNVIACSIFGDQINSCLFLMYNETDATNKQHKTTDRRDEDRDFNSFAELHNNRPLEMFSNDENQSKPAFVSILNRIDDLFCIAIQSPKHTNDYDRLKEMHAFLQKLRVDSTQSVVCDSIRQFAPLNQANRNECQYSDNIDNSDSTKSKGSEFEKNNSERMQERKMFSKSSGESQSNDSCHTFRIETRNKHNSKNGVDNDISNATYSIQSSTSDPSNFSSLTYEVKKKHQQ